MKAKLDIRQITFAALTGALYVTLCYFGNIFGLSFGIFQCRFAEALTVLPFLCPSSAWGLFTARCRNKWLAPLPPVICNGLIVGALLAWYQTGFTAAFPAAFAFNAVSVGGAELLVCYVLGLPLLEVLTRSRVLPQRAV